MFVGRNKGLLYTLYKKGLLWSKYGEKNKKKFWYVKKKVLWISMEV